MKKYDLEIAIEKIEKQMEEFKKEALVCTDEQGLEMAYAIMSTNPKHLYFHESFDKISFLITSLKVAQVFNLLKVEETKENIDNMEAVIKYTQFRFIVGYLKQLKAYYGEKDRFFSVWTKDYDDIEKVAPICEERYYIIPLFVEIYYVDEEGSAFDEIQAWPRYFCYHPMEDEEVEKIFGKKMN